MKRTRWVVAALIAVGIIAVPTTAVAQTVTVYGNSKSGCYYHSYDAGLVNGRPNGSAYYWCSGVGGATSFVRLFSMKLMKDGKKVQEKSSSVQNLNVSSSLSITMSTGCVHNAVYQSVSQVALKDMWGDTQTFPASYSQKLVLC